jgi:1-acyl-sn-glycerol-3-phosphate acyltransferase
MKAAVHPGAALLASAGQWASRPEVRWLWRPEGSRPRIYYANHSSHLDALVLWASLPPGVRESTRPVAARDYWERTRLRCWLATRLFGSVMVGRLAPGPFAARAPLLEELDHGGSLILFPEGTRGDGAEIGEFKSGLYQLCRMRPGVEAIPVLLENMHRILPKGGVLPSRARSRAVFGAPLSAEDGESKRQFLWRAREALRELRRR